MAANTVVHRVKDFLEAHPPFSYLPTEVLLSVSEQVHIHYFQQNEWVFKEGTLPHEFAYLLHKGRVELYRTEDGQTRLMDICQSGDTFGMRAFLTRNPFSASAKAASDSLVYAIPRAVFMPLFEEFPQLPLYFAAGFAAGYSIVHATTDAARQARQQLRPYYQNNNAASTVTLHDDERVTIPYTPNVVQCAPELTVQEAARLMKTKRVGSVVVVNGEGCPVGIVSDSDFTRKVIAEGLSASISVHRIMSSPVVTVSPEATVAQFTTLSAKKGIRRIVVTKDGLPQSPVVGIVSERDVIALQGNNPAVIVKRILKSESIDQLVILRNGAENLLNNYLQQEMSVEFMADIITQINDALIQKAIERSQQILQREHGLLPPPDVRFAWLSLGSEGRGEQLLRTDLDNAILYQNPPEALRQTAQTYFVALGREVVEVLVKCGFERCKGDVMASNPMWTKSLDEWLATLNNWITMPDEKSVMHGNIFFDFRACYGDSTLADELDDALLRLVAQHKNLFAQFYVADAIQVSPPLSFFKNLIVEKSGAHKDQLDIKKRGIMPLAAAARLMTASAQAKCSRNTFSRYRKLGERYPADKMLFEEAAMSYEIFLRTRVQNGIKHQNAGQFIQPKDLNTIQRQALKSAFGTIEAIQKYLKNHFFE